MAMMQRRAFGVAHVKPRTMHFKFFWTWSWYASAAFVLVLQHVQKCLGKSNRSLLRREYSHFVN